MNGKYQFKRRSIISFLLAGFLLAVTAIPTLAWFDEGEGFQAARTMTVINKTTSHPTAAPGTPQLPWSLIRAE